MKINIKPVPAIMATLALWGLLVLTAMLIWGCSTTPPTALERKLFDIYTNYTPVVTWQTNTVYQTNIVVEKITVTNQIGQVVPILVTNFIAVPTPQVVPIFQTNVSWTYQPMTNGLPAMASGAAGTIGNIIAPGVGGPIAGAVIPTILALWAWVRGNKQSAAANSLAQTIETGRELLKTLPNGAALDAQWTTWMQNNQAAVGVLPQVLTILDQAVDNQQAKAVSDQIKAAVTAMQRPPV